MAVEELKEKVAYLQGLANGLGLDTSTKEGQILIEMLGVLNSMAQALVELKEAEEDLEEYLESVDEDLYDLEEEVLGRHEDDDDDDDGDKDGEDDEEEHIEVECPECHETVCFDQELLDEEGTVEVSCPKCNTVVFTTGIEGQEDGTGSGGKEDE